MDRSMGVSLDDLLDLPPTVCRTKAAPKRTKPPIKRVELVGDVVFTPSRVKDSTLVARPKGRAKTPMATFTTSRPASFEPQRSSSKAKTPSSCVSQDCSASARHPESQGSMVPDSEIDRVGGRRASDDSDDSMSECVLLCM